MNKHAIIPKFNYRVLALVTMFLGLLLPTSLMAQSTQKDWWFEIEVILFKRKVDVENMTETFKPNPTQFDFTQAEDLLSPYIQPDISYLRDALPLCQSNDSTKQNHQVPGIVYDFPKLQSPLPQPESEPDMQQQNSLAEPVVDDLNGDIDPINFIPNKNLLIVKETQPQVVFDSWQMPNEVACVYPQEQQLLPNPFVHNWQRTAFLSKVPAVIDGAERLYSQSPYLIPADSLRLNYLYKAIKKQRDLTSLLHLGWRQQVLFGRNKAPYFRLFAGKNFANEYAQSGEKLLDSSADIEIADTADEQNPMTADGQDQQQLYANIQAALNDDSPLKIELPLQQTEQRQKQTEQVKVEQLWELDGLFKVYLQNVNRVPYLHIESELEYHMPVVLPLGEDVDMSSQAPSELKLSNDKSFLQPYNLNQLRRVISKQIHYFDHPLFGMVVQIRRHQRPEGESEPDQIEPNSGELSN